MDFTALKAELVARGFDYLSTTRQGQFINDAMHELDDLYTWPYRETSSTGAAPLSITTLGIIQQVINSTRNAPLEPRSYQWLIREFGDLSTSGQASYYYVSWTSGGPKVVTYPTNSDTLAVLHWKIATDLSAGADLPLSPTRYHTIIVDIAVRMALVDADNYSAAAALQTEIERKTARMANALLGGQQLQGPLDFARLTVAEDL